MGVKLNFDGFFFSKKIIFFPKNGEKRVKKGKNREKSQKFPKKSGKIPKHAKNYLEVDLTIWDFLGHPGSLLHVFRGVRRAVFGRLVVLVHVPLLVGSCACKTMSSGHSIEFHHNPTPTPPTSYHKLCKSA